VERVKQLRETELRQIRHTQILSLFNIGTYSRPASVRNAATHLHIYTRVQTITHALTHTHTHTHIHKQTNAHMDIQQFTSHVQLSMSKQSNRNPFVCHLSNNFVKRLLM